MTVVSEAAAFTGPVTAAHVRPAAVHVLAKPTGAICNSVIKEANK